MKLRQLNKSTPKSSPRSSASSAFVIDFAPGLVGTFQDSEGGGGRHGSSPPSNGDGYRFGRGDAAGKAAAAAIPRLRSRSSGLAFPQLRYAASNWKNDRLWGGQTSCASVG